MSNQDESSLEQTLIECKPFQEGAATIVCISCFKLLVYPFGAKRIKCGNCSATTDGLRIRCTSCNATVRVPLDCTQIRCRKCNYSFKPQATLRIKPPSWARSNEKELQLSVRVIIDKSIVKASIRDKVVQIIPNQPLRVSTVTWEEEFDADFRTVGYFSGRVQLDTSQTPMGLGLRDGAVIEVHRVESKSIGHQFVSSQFGTPTNCAFCKEFIWGIYHQGRKCAKCKLPVHHRCADKVTSMCEADRRNLFGIVNFNCEDDEAESEEPVIAVVVSDADRTKFASCVEEKAAPECDKNFMASLSKISNFSDQEIMDLWTNYDADGSGVLERGEIKQMLSDMVGVGGGRWDPNDPNVEDAVDHLISRLDQNHDGVISWDEFWYFYKAQQDAQFLEQFRGAKLTTEQLYDMWYHYDADESGSLEPDEVLQLISDIGTENAVIVEKNKTKFESLLSPGAKITWETFYTTIVPVIMDSLKHTTT